MVKYKIPKKLTAEKFGFLIILLTAVFLLTLYLIHMNYLDPLIGSFVYIMLTVSALVYLPGVLTKMLCSVGLSIALTYLIYVINPALFLGICCLMIIGFVFFLLFVASSFRFLVQYGTRGLALGFGIGVGGYVGYHAGKKILRKHQRKRKECKN